MILLEDAKKYLRVDSSDEDALIENMIAASEKLVCDVLRVSEDDELLANPICYIAKQYAIAYMYEPREEANHDELIKTLRSILSGIRLEVF